MLLIALCIQSYICYSLGELPIFQDLLRSNVEDLFNLLKADNQVKFQWIKRRIQQMWPHWQAALKSLKHKKDLANTVQKKVSAD